MLQRRLLQGIIILNVEIMTMETSIMGKKTKISKINWQIFDRKQFSLTINHQKRIGYKILFFKQRNHEFEIRTF